MPLWYVGQDTRQQSNHSELSMTSFLGIVIPINHFACCHDLLCACIYIVYLSRQVQHGTQEILNHIQRRLVNFNKLGKSVHEFPQPGQEAVLTIKKWSLTSIHDTYIQFFQMTQSGKSWKARTKPRIVPISWRTKRYPQGLK